MKKLLKPALLLAAIAIMVIGMISSGAWFTDTATTSTAAISSGTLSLDDAKLSTLQIGEIVNMAPGDVTGDAVIIIENNGTLPLAWFGNLIVSDSPLKNVIYVDYAQMEFLSPAGAAWEPVDNFILNGKGAGSWPTIWTGPENYATLAVFDGAPGMAPGTPYEFMGALKPGYKYRLTLRFGFYPGAGNEYQTEGPMNVSLNVNATQIKADALNALYVTLGNHVTWLNTQIGKQTMP